MNGIEELISAQLDGELDDHGQRELDAWLAADPEHPRRYLRAVIEHRALRERFAAERARPRAARSRHHAPIAMRSTAGLLVAAALAIALAGAWWASRPAPTPTLTPPEAPAAIAVAVATPMLGEARGVSLVRDGVRTTATVQESLRSRDRVTVDAAGAATLRYADGTTIQVAGGSELIIADNPAGKRLELDQGRIEAEMAAQPPGHPALFMTAEAEITVVGTTLAVARDGAETSAEVTHGRIIVGRRVDGATVTVAAGECASVAPGIPLAARALGSPAGTIYTVGAGQAYATLDALPELGPGDLVEVHAGTYRTARRWQASGTALRPIVIRGVGAATIDGEGVDVGGVGQLPRALFQIEGDHCVIEDLSFINARNGENGSAIRCLGARHTAIRRCVIAHCDDGIVAGDEVDDLVIEDCDIGWTGTPRHDGLCHGVYIGGAHAVVRGCRIHDAQHGQALKSSCRRIEVIACRITGADDGEISFIDGPGTGDVDSGITLIGNLVAAKPDRRGNHRRFIEVGSDSDGMRGGTLVLRHNTFVAADPRNVFIDTERSATRVAADGNVFVGSDHIAILGTGSLAGHGNWLPATAETPAGLLASIVGTDPGFVDAANGDFHLRTDASALAGAAGEAPALEPAAGLGTAARRGPAYPGAFGDPR